MRPKGIFITGILVFVVFSVIAVTTVTRRIQRDLHQRCACAISPHTVQMDSIHVRGRDVYLYGRSIRWEHAHRAAEAVRRLPGVRQIIPRWIVTPPPSLEDEFQRLLEQGQLVFESGDRLYNPQCQKFIDSVAVFLIRHPQIRLLIKGHADSQGDSLANYRLSLQRAESVFNALIEKGFDPQRFAVKGYGDTRPLFDAEAPESLRMNRRVEFVLLEE